MSRVRSAVPKLLLALPLVDALCLITLACGSLLLLTLTTRPTAAALDIPVDAVPPNVVLNGFYGVEQNSGGAYRWARPQATIALPIAAPGTYEITLTSFDIPQAERQVRVSVEGQALTTYRPQATPQHYRFTVTTADWPSWLHDGDRSLRVALAADAYTPVGDSRSLGPALTSIQLVQRAGLPLPLGAQVALIAFVLLCYLALRSVGLQTTPTFLLLLGGGIAGLLSGVRAPYRLAETLLRFSGFLLRHPWWIFGTLSGVVLSYYLPLMRRRPRLLRVAWWGVLSGGIIAELAALLWLIWAKPRQFPFSDEYSTVRWLVRFRDGQLRWGDLWEFYYAHRLILMRPAHLLIIELTDWNEQLLLTMNIVVAAITVLCLGRIVAATIASPLLRRIAVLVTAIWVFALSQYEHFMTSFGFQYLLAIAGFAFGLWALSTRPQRSGFVLAAIGCVIASLASFEGLAAWFCLAPLVARRGRRWLLPWLGLALAVIVPYSINFPFGIARGSFRLARMVPFMLANLGAPLGTLNDLHADLVWMGDAVGVVPLLRAQAFAVASLVVVSIALIVTWHRTRTLASQLVWLCLSGFATASAFFNALARPLDEALISRHQNFAVLWWIGVCCCAIVALDATREQPAHRPTERIIHRYAPRLISLCALIVAGCFVQIGINSFITAQRWQAEFARKNACIFFYATMPDSCTASTNPAFVRLNMAYLAREQLMMFHDRPAAKPPLIQRQPATTPDISALRSSGMQPYAKFDNLYDPFLGNPPRAIQYPPLVVRAGQPYVLAGWAVDPTTFAPAAGVLVSIDGGEALWAPCEEAADWPAENFGQALRASGFRLTLPAQALSPGGHTLRITVVNAAMTGYFTEQRFEFMAR